MPKIKEDQVILDKDNKIYILKKINACSSCCFYKYVDCEQRLKNLFGYKFKFSSCEELIGSNNKSRQCFVHIEMGI